MPLIATAPTAPVTQDPVRAAAAKARSEGAPLVAALLEAAADLADDINRA